jgi:molybdopterin converting factor small subunit
MSITLFPVGFLKSFVKGADHLVLEGKEGKSLEVLCQEIGVPINLISVYLVNGETKTKDYRLQADDEVKVMALVAGG